MSFPGGSDSRESSCTAGDPGSIHGSGLEKGMQPTLVFLPGEFHGQRSLVGYSPWGRKTMIWSHSTLTAACETGTTIHPLQSKSSHANLNPKPGLKYSVPKTFLCDLSGLRT